MNVKTFIKNNFFFMLMIAFCIIFMFNFRIIQVSGNSMDTTLADKEFHFAKLNKEIERNDIIVANSEVLDCVIIKRVVGMPGDTIEIKDNVLYINGEAVVENYIKEEMVTNDLGPYTLQENEYFACGDNRNHSTDSRVLGPIFKQDIIGVMLF